MTLRTRVRAGLARGRVRRRLLTDVEREAVEAVFGGSLPAPDRIVLTDVIGVQHRAFVLPAPGGRCLVNIGEAYDDPLHHVTGPYPRPGKLLVHELTHVWQFTHAPVVSRLLASAVRTQVTRAPYQPGDGDRPWASYNLEQQATLVDEWFAPAFRGPPGFGPMDPAHPWFRFVEQDLRPARVARAARRP